jgi:uncharacterized SAM-binding protein YcdF (DUF218 family)
LDKARWIVVSICIVAVLSVIYFFRAPLLIGLAETWIVHQNVEPSDAILVLGGDVWPRALGAARLYRRGYAPVILISEPQIDPSSSSRIALDTKLVEQILFNNGVPKEAMAVLRSKSSGTYGEAVALRDWVRLNGMHKVIVPTGILYTRRVSWIFQRLLSGTGGEVRVFALQPAEYYTQLDWWRDKHGLLDFQKEIIKFAYYWIRH